MMNTGPVERKPRLRDLQKAQTREIILDAARRLLTKHDIGSLNISHVVAEAGVGRQTFYFHFGDKDALVRELVAQYNARGAEVMLRFPPAPQSKPALRAWLLEFSDFLQGVKVEYTMLFQLSHSMVKPHFGRPTIEAWVSALANNARSFATALTEGEMGDRARARAWLIIVNLTWAATVSWQQKGTNFADEAVTSAVDLLHEFLQNTRFHQDIEG